MVDTACAPEVGHLDDHSLADEDVLGLEVAVEDALDVHHDKRLHDLLEDPQYFLDGELFVLLLEVVEQVALLAVLHYDF